MPQNVEALLAAAQNRLQSGDAVAARELLQEAAQAHSLRAAVQLGIWELAGLGGPADTAAAVRRLRAAAELGDATACSLYAQLVAAGADGLQRDFGAAVAWLVRAAAAGDRRAATQLAMLLPADAEGSGDRFGLARSAAAAGEPIARAFVAQWPAAATERTVDWDRVREHVTLPHERPLPTPVVRSQAPRIAAMHQLFTRDECIYVALKGLPLLRPARVAIQDGGSAVDPMRSNDAAKFGLLEADVMMQSLDVRVAAALGHPAENGEGFALLRYEPGQQYLPHCDWIDPGRAASRPDLDHWGQRIATCVVYLNDGFEAGATEFPRLGLAFRGGIGDALLWENVRPDGSVDPLTLHAGRSPTGGVKFLLSKWMRNRSQAGHDS
jgi:prolyl 4-hydroxylase